LAPAFHNQNETSENVFLCLTAKTLERIGNVDVKHTLQNSASGRSHVPAALLPVTIAFGAEVKNAPTPTICPHGWNLVKHRGNFTEVHRLPYISKIHSFASVCKCVTQRFVDLFMIYIHNKVHILGSSASVTNTRHQLVG
jgi:hypothetical protein